MMAGCVADPSIKQDVLPDYPPVSDELNNIFQEEIKKSGEGKIIFNVPEKMLIRQSEVVTVRISRSFNEDLLRSVQGNGTTEIKSIIAVPSAKVSLTGDSDFFKINLKNKDEEKAIFSDKYTEWLYEVIPNQAGEANLYLNIHLIIENQDGKRIKEYLIPKNVKIEDDPITNTIIYIGNNILAILGLIISLLGLTWLGGVIVERVIKPKKTASKAKRVYKNRKNRNL